MTTQVLGSESCPLTISVISAMTGSCSEQAYGVDDDFEGVILNYVCSVALFCTAVHLWHSHGWRRASSGILTEAGMCIGYLLGGLVHHLFPNRASNSQCASGWFYVLFPLSYLAMIYSGWAWLGVTTRLPRVVLYVKVVWFIAAVLIATGGRG